MRMVLVMLCLCIAAPGIAAEPPAPPPPPAPADRPDADAARDTLDRLELDTTAITGNRELPRVMYVVPWKRADLGDLSGKPANSLLDEALAPVDRTVFRREIRYFDAVDVAAPTKAETPVTAPGEQP